MAPMPSLSDLDSNSFGSDPTVPSPSTVPGSVSVAVSQLPSTSPDLSIVSNETTESTFPDAFSQVIVITVMTTALPVIASMAASQQTQPPYLACLWLSHPFSASVLGNRHRRGHIHMWLLVDNGGNGGI